MDIELGKHLNITESYKWRVVLFKITILMTNCKVKEKITPNKKKKNSKNVFVYLLEDKSI